MSTPYQNTDRQHCLAIGERKIHPATHAARDLRFRLQALPPAGPNLLPSSGCHQRELHVGDMLKLVGYMLKQGIPNVPNGATYVESNVKRRPHLPNVFAGPKAPLAMISGSSEKRQRVAFVAGLIMS